MLWQTQTEAHAMMGAANTVNTGWNDPRAWLMDVPGEGSSPIMTDATDNVLHNDLINDCFMTEQDDAQMITGVHAVPRDLQLCCRFRRRVCQFQV